MPSQNDARSLVPDYQIKINGSDLKAKELADVMEVHVYQDVDAPAMFTIQFVNWDVASSKVTWSDQKMCREGSEVEIALGYLGKLESLIAGEITGLEPEFRAGEAPTLLVRGYDRLHRLLRGRQSRAFVKIKDSDIAQKISGEAGLTADVTDSQVQLDYVFQNNQTNWDFLRERAYLNGYELFASGKKLVFRPAKINGAAAVTLSLDGELIEFCPCLSTLQQVSQVQVQGWDIANKQAIVGTAKAGDETAQMGDQTGAKSAEKVFGAALHTEMKQPVFTRAEADQTAKGRYNQATLHYITGEGASIGNPAIQAGCVVKVEGAGDRFSGDYYVTAAHHLFSPARGYRTRFHFRRNAS